jgi:hypothetical protein
MPRNRLWWGSGFVKYPKGYNESICCVALRLSSLRPAQKVGLIPQALRALPLALACPLLTFRLFRVFYKVVKIMIFYGDIIFVL